MLWDPTGTGIMINCSSTHQRGSIMKHGLPQSFFCILAPSNVAVTLLSPNAVNVSWELASDSDGMDVYNAYANGFEEKYCRGKVGDLQCTLADLSPSTTYKFCVQMCHTYSSASIYQSSARTASIYSRETLLGSPKDSIAPKSGSNAGVFICGPPLCTSATTPSGKKHLLIVGPAKQP